MVIMNQDLSFKDVVIVFIITFSFCLFRDVLSFLFYV